MASCATRVDPLNLGNGAFGTTWRQYPRPRRGNEVGFRNSFKEVRKRQRLVVVSMSHTPVAVNMSQSQAESQLADCFTKEVNAEGAGSIVGKDLRNLQSESEWKTDIGGLGGDIFDGNGRNGKFLGGGGGGGGGRGGGGAVEGEDQEDEEFWPIMKFEEVIRETEARGATLPSDMLEAAKSVGITKLLLLTYLDLQGSGGLLGFEMISYSVLRNRMLADPFFLFKVGTEVLFKLGKSFKKYYDHDVYPKWRIVIDTCCATFAEIQKRGKDLWAEFELHVADLVVGAVVNAALVGMLAPWASKGFHGRLQNSYEALPIGVSEAERAGCRFSIKQRIATHFHKGVYGSIWLACGIIGQGIANLFRKGKRSIRNPEDDIPETPPVKTPVRPDVFSPSQISNGLETLVEASPPATRIVLTAVGFLLMLLLLMVMAFKINVRVTNNIYGGMQFVD